MPSPYEGTWVQRLDPSAYDHLPRYGWYAGDAPDLAHLRGRRICLRDVERLIYIGERENVWVLMPEGWRARPWYGCEPYRVDDGGKPIIDPRFYGEPIPDYGPNAMATGDLAVPHGMTDADLDRLARELLGEPWEPDRPGPSAKRRAMFDCVMAAKASR